MVKTLLDCGEARFDHWLKFEVGEDTAGAKVMLCDIEEAALSAALRLGLTNVDVGKSPRWAAERSAAILLFHPRSSEARLSRPFLRHVEQCATRNSLQFTKRRSSTACTLAHSCSNVFPLLMATAIW
jgi:hypothetical protein